MILHVDSTLALPVYEQIRSQVTRMAVSGILRDGTRLPTIRQLANDLGLAKGTVAKAYTLLEEDRVVVSRGRKGTFVAMADPVGEIDDGALREQTVAFITSVRQLGGSFDQAADALREHWPDED